jgi:hypothetical protein
MLSGMRAVIYREAIKPMLREYKDLFGLIEKRHAAIDVAHRLGLAPHDAGINLGASMPKCDSARSKAKPCPLRRKQGCSTLRFYAGDL